MRLTRFKDRLKKSGNTGASKTWNGNLDADGMFFFQCIMHSHGGKVSTVLDLAGIRSTNLS
jgi:hypothetical protein